MMTLRMFLNHSKSYLESRYLQNKAVEVELVNGQNERRSWIWAHGYDIIDIETKESYCNDVCRVRESIFIGQKPYNWPPEWLKGGYYRGIYTVQALVQGCGGMNLLSWFWYLGGEGVQSYFKQFNSTQLIRSSKLNWIEFLRALQVHRSGAA